MISISKRQIIDTCGMRLYNSFKNLYNVTRREFYNLPEQEFDYVVVSGDCIFCCNIDDKDIYEDYCVVGYGTFMSYIEENDCTFVLSEIEENEEQLKPMEIGLIHSMLAIGLRINGVRETRNFNIKQVLLEEKYIGKIDERFDFVFFDQTLVVTINGKRAAFEECFKLED